MNSNNKFCEFFQSKKFKKILLAIGALIVLLIVFGVGMAFGFRKANFSYRWAENYHRNFGGPREGLFKDFSGRDFINAHGISGSIIKIDGNTLIIKGQDNVEKTIVVSNQTVIRKQQETIKVSDLKVDDSVVIIGSPNNSGQTEAKLIRILPPSDEYSPTPMPKMRLR